MSNIKLFLQFQGSRKIELVEVDDGSPARELVAAAVRAGFAGHDGASAVHVFGPDGETPLDLDVPLIKQGTRDKQRVHVNRCPQVNVTLHFNEVTEVIHFPPSATVDRVKKRFVQKIGMTPVDATEHVLQLCRTSDRPDPDVQIGSLLSEGCAVCFDLVPIKRIEG